MGNPFNVKMKHICLFAIMSILGFAFCTNSKKDNSKLQESKPKLYNNTDSDMAPLWKKLCVIQEFEIISNCNIENKYAEYYEVALTNDPFKPIIIMTLFFRNSQLAELYLTQIEFSADFQIKYKNYSRMDSIIQKTPVYLYYNVPKRIDLKAIHNKGEVLKLEWFFTHALWSMPESDTNQVFFDPEIWAIKAFKDNNQKVISRQTWDDKVFYSNIQRLLDLCNVTDYTYKRKK
jgi:hypothetical protein